MTLEVLIVEDDEILVLIHESWVKKSLISVNPISFFNGKAALDYFLNNHKKDKQYLILLDLNMPVMDGWDFLENISNYEFAEQIHVVIVSSSTTLKDKEKATTYKNVIAFIEKPINMESCNRIKSLSRIASYFSN
ncbi:MAG TPA: response regulator [Cytophagales bacterium]|nr:response regulator [Cytophagales bacterium]